jgi:hypothetical protein
MTRRQREKMIKIFAIVAIGSLLMTSIASFVFSII